MEKIDIKSLQLDQLKEYITSLGAKAFVAEEKRRMIFLHPEKFLTYDNRDWNGYFFSTQPEGYHEGKHMDFNIFYGTIS